MKIEWVSEWVSEWVIAIRVPPKPHEWLRHPWAKSKGSVSQLMDDLYLIIEQVEVMVNSIQKGVENVLRK